MKEKTKDTIISVAVIIALLYAGTSAFIYSFRGDKEVNVTFNVTGVVNATNSSTIQIHFECIKFCGKDLAYSSNDKVKLCWEQCADLR